MSVNNYMQSSWKEIEKHYLEAKSYMPTHAKMHTAMAEFCRWLDHCPMSESLFGRTSHHDLHISQSKFDGFTHPSIQFLSVLPKFETGEIEFRFLDTFLQDRQWSRSEPPIGAELVNRFVGFVRQVGWDELSGLNP